jgi:MoaA/NifB/PqqE/SkfB family radical SAM enzyme
MTDAASDFVLEALMLYPTLRCNLRCRFCYQSDFETSLADSILDSAFESHFPALKDLLVVGGEISTSSRIFDFVSRVATTYPTLKIHLTTNGTGFGEHWIRLAVRHACNVNVSLHSFDARRYAEWLPEMPATAERAWHNAYTNLVTLEKTAMTSGREDVSIMVSKVVLPGDYGDLAEYLQWAAALRVGVRLLWDCREAVVDEVAAGEFLSCLLPITTDVPNKSPIRISGLRLPPALRHHEGASVSTSTRYALATTATNARLPLGYALTPDTDPPPVHVESADVSPAKFSDEGKHCNFGAGRAVIDGVQVCSAPWRSAVVMAQGQVMFCPNLHNYVLGNINETPLGDLVHSEAARLFRRDMLDQRCSYCPSWCSTRPVQMGDQGLRSESPAAEPAQTGRLA